MIRLDFAGEAYGTQYLMLSQLKGYVVQLSWLPSSHATRRRTEDVELTAVGEEMLSFKLFDEEECEGVGPEETVDIDRVHSIYVY